MWRAIRGKGEEAAKVRHENHNNDLGEEEDSWGFLSFTLVLPEDLPQFLDLLSREPSTSLWIAKPSRLNRGNGIRLVNRDSDLEELRTGTESVCLQRYLASPFLLDNQKKVVTSPGHQLACPV